MAESPLPLLKLCRKCGQQKPATKQFFKTTKYGGLTSPCRRCQLAHSAKMHRAKPETARKRARDWYEANRERANERSRAYYRKHRQRFRRLFDEYYQRNASAFVARAAAWKVRNPERWRQLRAAWLAIPENKARRARQLAASDHKRRAQKSASKTHFTAGDIARLLTAQKRKCWWCGAKLDRHHVDHRIPLSKGGSNGPENIVLSCPSCNLKKNAKMPWEFASRLL